MCAAVVEDAVTSGSVCVIDVRVAPRHRVVRRPIGVGEGDMVGAHETAAAVANVCAPAEIDPWNGECVCRPFGQAVRDGDAELRDRSLWCTRRLRWRDPNELD